VDDRHVGLDLGGVNLIPLPGGWAVSARQAGAVYPLPAAAAAARLATLTLRSGCAAAITARASARRRR
jgi:hypothetical protein